MSHYFFQTHEKSEHTAFKRSYCIDGENHFVASTKRFVDIASEPIVVGTISLFTATL